MSRPGAANGDEELLAPNTIVSDRWRVVKRLGKGGYGEIYSCLDQTSGEMCALKCEKTGKSGSLMSEVAVLKVLRGCKYAPQIISAGSHEVNGAVLSYFTMDLLGENLSTLRRVSPAHLFGIATTMALGMQMLRALKAIHCAGFVHRDLKPGNFVVGREGTPFARKVLIIDFGLSKRHLLEDGNARPKRSSARWVGSRRYMSPNTHFRKEQGRRDDLISLMYVLVEFATGSLPWAHLRGLGNLDRVRDMKMSTTDDKLFFGLPEEMRQMMAHIRGLEYEDRPDYSLLHSLMMSCFKNAGGTDLLQLDWELPQVSEALPMNFDMSATETMVLYRSDYLNELDASSSSDTQSTEEPVPTDVNVQNQPTPVSAAKNEANSDEGTCSPNNAPPSGVPVKTNVKRKKKRCAIM